MTFPAFSKGICTTPMHLASAHQHPHGGCYQPLDQLADLPVGALSSQEMSSWAQPLQWAQLKLEVDVSQPT